MNKKKCEKCQQTYTRDWQIKHIELYDACQRCHERKVFEGRENYNAAVMAHMGLPYKKKRWRA